MKPSASPLDPRNHALAKKAKRRGMKNSLRIVCEARSAGLPISLAFAIIEQETGNGANVFGHDRTIFVGAGEVTRRKYLEYRAQRDRVGTSQGVGPMQLTWKGYQDEADQLGGCWIPKYNIRVGFRALASNIRSLGMEEGVRSYNGTGHAAVTYAETVLKQRMPRWHEALK